MRIWLWSESLIKFWLPRCMAWLIRTLYKPEINLTRSTGKIWTGNDNFRDTHEQNKTRKVRSTSHPRFLCIGLWLRRGTLVTSTELWPLTSWCLKHAVAAYLTPRISISKRKRLWDLSICSPGTLMEKRAGWTKSKLTVHTSDYARRISGKERKKLYAQVDTYVNSAHS